MLRLHVHATYLSKFKLFTHEQYNVHDVKVTFNDKSCTF